MSPILRDFHKNARPRRFRCYSVRLGQGQESPHRPASGLCWGSCFSDRTSKTLPHGVYSSQATSVVSPHTSHRLRFSSLLTKASGTCKENKEKQKVLEASRHSRKGITGSLVHCKYSFLESKWDPPHSPTQACQGR